MQWEPRSYWQRGNDDGYAGRSMKVPNPSGGQWDRENQGYQNGWKFGRDKREREARAIYDGWKGQPGWLPWIVNGNSHRQDDARRLVGAADDQSAQGERNGSR